VQRIQGAVPEEGQNEGPVPRLNDLQGGVAFGIGLAAGKAV